MSSGSDPWQKVPYYTNDANAAAGIIGEWPRCLTDDGAKLRSDAERGAIRLVAGLAARGLPDPTGAFVPCWCPFHHGKTVRKAHFACCECGKTHMHEKDFPSLTQGKARVFVNLRAHSDHATATWTISYPSLPGDVAYGGRLGNLNAPQVKVRHAPPEYRIEGEPVSQRIRLPSWRG